MTLCDADIEPKSETGSIITNKEGKSEKVYIDRTSQLLVSTAIAIADIIKMKTKRKAYQKQQ